MNPPNQQQIALFLEQALKETACDMEVHLSDEAFAALFQNALEIALDWIRTDTKASVLTIINEIAREVIEDFVAKKNWNPALDSLVHEMLTGKISEVDARTRGPVWDHYIDLAVPQYQIALANRPKVEQCLFLLWIEENFVATKIIEQFPVLTVEYLALYETNARNIAPAHRKRGQQEFLRLRESMSIEDIVQQRPRFNFHKPNPDDLVAHIVSNKVNQINQA